MFRKFNQKGGTNVDTKAFLESNSMIARAAFLILVLLVFIILLSLSTKAIKWFFSPSKNPKIINGMKRGRESLVVPANPQNAEAWHRQPA